MRETPELFIDYCSTGKEKIMSAHTATPAQIAALADAQAAAIGLPLAAAHRPGTIQNLQVIARMAQLVMEFPLPRQTEPAPVFSHDKS